MTVGVCFVSAADIYMDQEFTFSRREEMQPEEKEKQREFNQVKKEQ